VHRPVALRAGNQANWPGVRMICLLVWPSSGQESFSWKEVHFKQFCLPMETSCHPAENVNESPIQWIIDVFVLVFAADLMNKKTCKTYSSELAVKYVLLFFFKTGKQATRKNWTHSFSFLIPLIWRTMWKMDALVSSSINMTFVFLQGCCLMGAWLA